MLGRARTRSLARCAATPQHYAPVLVPQRKRSGSRKSCLTRAIVRWARPKRNATSTCIFPSCTIAAVLFAIASVAGILASCPKVIAPSRKDSFPETYRLVGCQSSSRTKNETEQSHRHRFKHHCLSTRHSVEFYDDGMGVKARAFNLSVRQIVSRTARLPSTRWHIDL